MTAHTDEPSVSLETADELLASIAQTQATLEELKEELRDLPRRLAERFTDADQRRTLAHSLYWSVPEIPVSAIAKHLLGCKVHEVPTRIGGQKAEINCNRCGDAVAFMSRTALVDAQRMFRSNARGGQKGSVLSATHAERRFSTTGKSSGTPTTNAIRLG